MLHFAGYPPIAKRRVAPRCFIEGAENGVMGSQVCHDAEKKIFYEQNVVYLIKI